MSSLQVILAASLASALVGGVAGGFVVTSMNDSEATVKREPVKGKSVTSRAVTSRAVTSRAKSDESNDVGEVTRLEARIAELEGRIGTLQRQQQSRAVLKDYAKALAEGDDAEPEAKDSAKRMPGVVDAEDPTFELAVRTVMDRIDWEKTEEQKLVRAKRLDERAQRQTALLTERLKLDEQQAGAVAAALGVQMQRFRALREADGTQGVERPATRSEWRERIAEIRSQTEEELREVLDEEQLKGYRAVAEEEGIGARGWNREDRRERRENPAPE